jgi:hypothetical protein
MRQRTLARAYFKSGAHPVASFLNRGQHLTAISKPHDPTALFAGIAQQARRRFGIAARQVHVDVDTTSFSVSGEYVVEEADGTDPLTIAVTYGYSRDHRADLKQWMLALATTRQGDMPLFCRALDGNASDKVSLLAAVEALAEQLRPADEDEGDIDAEVPSSWPIVASIAPKMSAASARSACAGSVVCPILRRRRARRCGWPTTPGSRSHKSHRTRQEPCGGRPWRSHRRANAGW